MRAEIRVVESQTPVDHVALHRAIREIRFDDDVGLASEVAVDMNLWDEQRGEYDIAASESLYHGNEFELWTVDDATTECLGRFKVETRSTTYSEDGPGLSVQAFDGLRALMMHTEARVYHGVTNDYTWLKALAEEHGFDLDSDPSFFPSIAGDRFKELGKTDLEFVRTAAMAHGLGMPVVVYDPATRRESLRVRPLAAMTQGFEPRRLRVSPDGSGDADLVRFSTTWDAGEVPIAVEVVGYDQAARKPYRVVVEATPTGPRERVREYRDIPRSDSKRVAPGRGGESRGVVVHLLGERLEAVDTGIFLTVRSRGKTKRIRSRRQYREILHTTFAEGVDSAVDFARRWIETRIDGYFTAQGETIPNAVSGGRFRASQAHYVAGTMPDDEGWYILTGVSQVWSDDGHRVSFDAQRLIVEAANSAVARTRPRG